MSNTYTVLLTHTYVTLTTTVIAGSEDEADIVARELMTDYYGLDVSRFRLNEIIPIDIDTSLTGDDEGDME